MIYTGRGPKRFLQRMVMQLLRFKQNRAEIEKNFYLLELAASRMTPWHGKIFALLRNKRKDGAASEEESGKGCDQRGKKARLL